MVLVVGAAIWRGGGSSCPVEDRTLSKTFRLDGHKLGRLYDLLRPKDVPVAVAMRRGHLIVEGTEREVRDIERFMALVGAAGDARNPDPRWVDAEYLSHSYHLSKEHAARLDQVLSFADVHGFSICTGSILTVEASEDFHDALMPVVRILGGTRLD